MTDKRVCLEVLVDSGIVETFDLDFDDLVVPDTYVQTVRLRSYGGENILLAQLHVVN
jgi:hypothetical protein